MTTYSNRNKDMYLSEWYEDYLLTYVAIISKPKFSQKQTASYNETLLRWYENFNGYMEKQ